jgi:hypothetical protein
VIFRSWARGEKVLEVLQMSLRTGQSPFWHVVELYLIDLQPPQASVPGSRHMAQSDCTPMFATMES